MATSATATVAASTGFAWCVSGCVMRIKTKPMPYYDASMVHSHGTSESRVFLMNEAPGRCEAHYRIPSFGMQGGNIYHSLRKAGISWATQFEKIVWPAKISSSPTNQQKRFIVRDAFIHTRAQYITCSNAYPQWPRSEESADDFVDPSIQDVLSALNIDRIRLEVRPNHRVLLICGAYAWHLCAGHKLDKPANRERTSLTNEEITGMNRRLNSNFEYGWYMGHTRRWSLKPEDTSRVLKSVATVAGWHHDPLVIEKATRN